MLIRVIKEHHLPNGVPFSDTHDVWMHDKIVIALTNCNTSNDVIDCDQGPQVSAIPCFTHNQGWQCVMYRHESNIC